MKIKELKKKLEEFDDDLEVCSYFNKWFNELNLIQKIVAKEAGCKGKDFVVVGFVQDGKL